MHFPFKKTLFILFLATMMVPLEVTFLTNLNTVVSLGWYNSYAGLTVPFLATGFGAFLLRQAFLGLPGDLRDASKLDGAGHWQFLREVALPVARPAVAVLGIFSFFWAFLGVAAHGDQFGNDADGDFFGSERADFEAHWREHAVKLFRRESFLFERPINRQHFALAADHADVARFGADGPGEHAHIVFVASRDDHEEAGRIRLDLLIRFGERSVDLRRHREALRIRERLAIVDDADGEARLVRHARDGRRDVPAAKKVQHRLRQDRLDENLERASADQAGVVRWRRDSG